MGRYRDEIQKLKAQWLNDPCWDLETTEGFEEHWHELAAFRATTEARWRDERRERLWQKAERYGCSRNLALASYLEGLEHDIAELQDEVERLKTGGGR